MKSYCFGIDVGGTSVKCGLFNTDGTLLEKWEIPTRTENKGENILPDVAETIKAKIAARPPVYLPKKALAVFMRRLDIPPPPIISPARTKNGIDIVVKESALVTRFCTIYPDVKSPETKMVIKEAIPKDIDTGTFRIKSTTSEPNNTRLIIHFHPLFIIFNSQYNCLNTSDC